MRGSALTSGDAGDDRVDSRLLTGGDAALLRRSATTFLLLRPFSVGTLPRFAFLPEGLDQRFRVPQILARLPSGALHRPASPFHQKLLSRVSIPVFKDPFHLKKTRKAIHS